MDKKLIVYSKRKTSDWQEQESSSSESPGTVSKFSGSSSQNTTEKPSKKRKNPKSELHAYNGSRNLWKNLAHVFAKSNDVQVVETAGVKLMKGKDSTMRRLSSFFKHRAVKSARDSSGGSEASESEANTKAHEEKMLAMAVRLPPGMITEDVTVAIELEVAKKGEKSTKNVDGDDAIVLKCDEETKSKTTFTGILKVPPNTDISRLSNMPLYLIDSKEKIVLNPSSKLSHRTLIRPSQDVLASDDENQVCVSDIKIKLTLDKVKEKLKNASRRRSSENNTARGKISFSGRTGEIHNVLGELATFGTEKSDNNANYTKFKNICYTLTENTSKNGEEKPATADNIVEHKTAIDYVEEKHTIDTLTKENGNGSENPVNRGDDESEKTEEEKLIQKFEMYCEGFFPSPPVVENPVEWLNATYTNPCQREKTIRDSSTQYSFTNFTANKEIDVQGSLTFTHYGIFNERHNKTNFSDTSTNLSSQMFLAPSSNITRKVSQISKSPQSSETVLPKSTTSISTEYSNTFLSYTTDFASYHNSNELKVPWNSPSSCVELKGNDQKKVRSVRNDMDLSISRKDIEKHKMKNKKPEKSRTPLSYEHLNGKIRNTYQQTDGVPLICSDIIERRAVAGIYNKFGNFVDVKDELSSTELLSLEKSVKIEENDKTLELLEGARSKLVAYLGKNDHSSKVKKISDKDLVDVCGLLPTDHDLDGLCANRFPETRHLSVNRNNPFDPNRQTQTYKNEEIARRCYEDDDEYYERQRRDVRRYFEVESHEAKKNFNFYLSGDNLEKEVHPSSPNKVFHVYPLMIGNNPQVKSLKNLAKTKVEEANISKAFPLQGTNKNSNNTENSVNSKLESEMNSLQHMYDDMCSSMKFLFDLSGNSSQSTSKEVATLPKAKSGEMATIEDDLTNTFSELKECLSTINQILTTSTNSLENIMSPVLEPFKTTSDLRGGQETKPSTSVTGKHLSEERHQTYFTMEHEIERTIEELLKESKDIKEAVILSGGKEEAEPPFSFEYINALTERNPLIICKTILDDLLNSSVLKETKTNNETGGPQEDVKYILDVLLEEVDKCRIFLDKPKKLQIENFLCETTCRGNSTDLQIGDVTTEQSRLKFGKNDHFTYFCNTLNSRIPKTSFSFGETPFAYSEVPHSPCRTPEKRRDCLTRNEASTRNVETSRLISELLNLQSDLDDREKYTNKVKNEDDMSPEDEYNSAHEIEESHKFASVAHILENSIPEESFNSQLQEVFSFKPTYTLQMAPHKNSVTNLQLESENGNNSENSDSGENTPKHSSKNEDKNDKGQTSSGIPKSQKCVQLTDSVNKDIPKNLPSTSTKFLKRSRTTEEEELLQNLDLTRILSSSGPEYFICENVSSYSQESKITSQTGTSQIRESSSSSEEVAHPVSRKPPKRKRKEMNITEIKAKTSIISDSDSGNLQNVKQPTINTDQGLMSDKSHIVLKSVNAQTNIQDTKSNTPAKTEETEIVARDINISDLSVRNDLEVSDTEYEGDLETFQARLPNPIRRYKSKQELNTPEEIALIEENVKENDQLQKKTRIVLIASDASSQLQYEDSSEESKNSSVLSAQLQLEPSGELKVIELGASTSSILQPTTRPSKSRSTI